MLAAKKRSSMSTSDRTDAYQAITDQIIELLEAGTAPWHQPWSAEAGVPLSMSTKKHYRGVNVFILATAAQTRGYGSPWWGTYKQITERGGQVRKGEKGTMIVFWKQIMVDDKETGERKRLPMLRTFTVFNAEQADGDLGLPQTEATVPTDAIAECDDAVTMYLATGPTLVVGGDRASYSPALDQVRMPERDAFDGSEQYYGTLFHELVHSTGHESRLARPNLLNFHSFGDENYSKEELVAEMGSAFLSGITGIAAATLSNSANYLQGWIKALRGDRKLLVHAAANAQKAADMILGVTYESE